MYTNHSQHSIRDPRQIPYRVNLLISRLEDFLLEVIATIPHRSTDFLEQLFHQKSKVPLESVTQLGRFQERYNFIIHKELLKIPDRSIRDQINRALSQNRFVGYSAILLRADSILHRALSAALGDTYHLTIQKGLRPEKKEELLKKIITAITYQIYE